MREPNGRPAVSIVVPTRNRQAAITRLLSLLAREAEAEAEPRFDVIVVDDGSTDGTAAALRRLMLPFPLDVVPQASGGSSRARNAAAARARGDVLLFLDDDVEPEPGLVRAHVQLHARHDDVVGLGDLPPIIDDSSYFGTILRGWWDGMRDGIRQPGYRYGFRDLLTGHFSIRRQHFEALGGFDPDLRCHEDWDFGYRVLAAGHRLQFVPGAVARHRDDSTLAKVLQRKSDEGVADVQLARKHPELAAALPLAWPGPSWRQRTLRACAWARWRGAGTVPQLLLQLLPLYEIVRLRFRWRRVLNALLTYWYWRGVASATTRNALDALAHPPVEAPPEVVVDLQPGVAAAARQLDALRPARLVLVYGHDVVGVVEHAPGRERWHGEHLPLLLARWFPIQYRRALAHDGRVPPPFARFAAEDVQVRRPAAAARGTTADGALTAARDHARA